MNKQDTSAFNELDEVRVVHLNHPEREISGTERVQRQPVVGDVGTVVALLKRAYHPPGYYVECVDANGLTVWLAAFDRDELELVARRAA